MKLYNTLTNSLEEFKPINENKVKMYVCGPTVYNYIHIGNARPLIVFDVLARLIIKKGYELEYVQNFTDIDDKIIKKAIEENTTCDEITNKYIKAFYEDIEKLNILSDIKRPKVTENIENIIEMISELIRLGYAYENNGDVLFSIEKYKDYGKLSKQKLDELNKGVRIKVDDSKKNPFDFVLWKAKKENEPYYQSPFGDGRPGWHIECSAMIKEYLGDEIDIHAGGQDLIFPHHENEIAQSICSTNEKSKFVKYWLHNSYITVDMEKMSKSLGNFKLLREVLNEYDANTIRHFILKTHYRKGLNFSYEELESSKKTIENINKAYNKFAKLKNDSVNDELIDLINDFETKFIIALEDDINTVNAMAASSVFIKSINKLISENENLNYNLAANKLKELYEILGIKLMEEKINDNKLIEVLLEIRKELRAKKEYELADKIRTKLNELGIEVSDK